MQVRANVARVVLAHIRAKRGAESACGGEREGEVALALAFTDGGGLELCPLRSPVSERGKEGKKEEWERFIKSCGTDRETERQQKGGGGNETARERKE